MNLPPGSRLGPYEIRRLLGRGGMGEVYVALDPRLRRKVALKVLPAGMAGDASHLERFRREAESLAALSHPNIVTIFSVEEDSGTHFLTMELVVGRPVDELLNEGRLDRETFFDVGIALADAVAAAHARGIVHRDLKPGNLVLSDEGRLKVLDFGLAKLAPDSHAEEETAALLTAVGRVIGTAAYMSPEQANGKPVDLRSDVFSLGAVLYELATSKRPFDGDGLASILHAVMSHEPLPVSALRGDLPLDLDLVVSQCLVKSVEERRQTAAQVRDRLRELRHGAPAIPLDAATLLDAEVPAALAAASSPSNLRLPVAPPDPRLPMATAASRSSSLTFSSRPVIAVLPFRCLTSDPEIEDFTASLGSDVVDGVASTSQALVLPGSATERFGDGSIDVRQVGEDLGAGYVVQGTVRCGGERLRVTAQLVSVASGTQVWSRRYERNLGEADLFDAGDEIGAGIVSAVSDVHGVIFEVERQRLEGRPVEELDAWECIFITLGYDKFADAEHHLLARQALERAIELDRGFPLAWGYLSWVVSDEALYGFNVLPDSMQRAASAARRAVELDPNSHMLRWLQSRVHFFEGDIDGFLSESAKSLELSSSDATTLGLIGMYTSLAGRWKRGAMLMRRAMKLNPSYPSYYHFAFALDHFRRAGYSDALEEFRRVTFGGGAVFQGLLPAILGHLGRKVEAASALRDFRRLLPEATPTAIRALYRSWNVHGELMASMLEGMAKAGLPMDGAGSPSAGAG